MKTVTRRMTTSYTICNDGLYQYSFFADKAKNDINGNTRFSITVLLKESAITFTQTCQEFQIKEEADEFVRNYFDGSQNDKFY